MNRSRLPKNILINKVLCIVEQYYCLPPPAIVKICFTGSGDKSNLDERADKCKLFQLSGLSVKFNNVIYLDAQLYCNKIFILCIKLLNLKKHLKISIKLSLLMRKEKL